MCAGARRRARDLWGDAGGQMSVEAALLLPCALTALALLMQPACVLYTRAVMAATAGELARVVATQRGGEDDLRSYALRRLAAVPDLAVFCEGGPDSWEVEAEGPDEDGTVRVLVATRVRPLPLLGVLTSALGEAGDGLVRLVVEVEQDVRADWLGGEYEDWVGIWG